MSALSTVVRALKRYGQDQTITSAGVDYTVRVLLTMQDSTSIGAFYDGNEAVGLTKPALLMYVAGDDPSAGHLENAVFFSDIFGLRPGTPGSFVVRKIYKVKIAGAVVIYVCACD